MLLIVDWGGVLIEKPGPKVTAYCAEKIGVSEDSFREAFRHYWKEYMTGTISPEDVWAGIGKQLGKTVPDNLYREAFEYAYEERAEMFTLIQHVKDNGHTVWLLSDTEPEAGELFLSKQYPMFDGQTFSFAVGVCKPDAVPYETVLRAAGFNAKDAAFIDDKPKNIAGAEQLGIKGILYENAEQVEKELRTLGVL